MASISEMAVRVMVGVPENDEVIVKARGFPNEVTCDERINERSDEREEKGCVGVLH
jgi:hypothetical protein